LKGSIPVTVLWAGALLAILFNPTSHAQTLHANPTARHDAQAIDGARSVEDRRLSIRVNGSNYSLAARMFHPAGVGPFPLVVINHGASVNIRDMKALTLDDAYTGAAQWFAAQGYAVVVALRPGVGTSQGPYLETTRPCARRDYIDEGRTTASVEAAIVQSAAALPGVDPKRIVVVGHSAGGFGATALADQPPPGVLGVISFAGGRGGDGHEHICGGQDRLVQAADVFGRANALPGLWLYAANDHFFPPPVAHAMFQAYRTGSHPKMTFIDLPAFANEGHFVFGQADPSVWAEPVSTFLRKIGAATVR
jgi:dienelactone hydrolase